MCTQQHAFIGLILVYKPYLPQDEETLSFRNPSKSSHKLAKQVTKLLKYKDPRKKQSMQNMEFEPLSSNAHSSSSSSSLFDDHIHVTILDGLEFETSNKFHSHAVGYEPLKLPPRLLRTPDFNNFSHRLPTSPSPMALKAARHISFARRGTWGDDFDPFTAAIEKVKGDKGGESRHPTSYSFRLTGYCSQILHKGSALMKQMQAPREWKPSCSRQVELNGEAYTRLVQGETQRPANPGGQFEQPLNCRSATKVEKLKAILQWPALFLKDKNGCRLKKASNDRKLRHFMK